MESAGDSALSDGLRTDGLHRSPTADAMGIVRTRTPNFEWVSTRHISTAAFPWAESGTERRRDDAKSKTDEFY